MKVALGTLGVAVAALCAIIGCTDVLPEPSAAGGGYQLQTTVSPDTLFDPSPGLITGTPPGTYAAGTRVTLIAQAARDWRFAGWEGDVEGEDVMIEFTLDQDYEVTANFVQQIELRITQVGGGGSVYQLGEEDRLEPVQESFDVGVTVELQAEPDEGWTFLGWSGEVTGSAETLTVQMDPILAGDDNVMSIQATFAETQTLSATIVGGEGVISAPNGEFDAGDQVAYDAIDGDDLEVLADPAYGHVFWGWQGEVPAGDEGSPALSLRMDRDRDIEAVFAPFSGFRTSFMLSMNIMDLDMPEFGSTSLTTYAVQSPNGAETRFFALGWNGLYSPFALLGRVQGTSMTLYSIDEMGLVPLVTLLLQEILGINLTGHIEANGAIQFEPVIGLDYTIGLVFASTPSIVDTDSPLSGPRVVELHRENPADPDNPIVLPGILLLAVNDDVAKGHLYFQGFDRGDGNAETVAWEIRGTQEDSEWTFELRTRALDADENILEWTTTISPTVDENGDWEAEIPDGSTPFRNGDRIITREPIDPFSLPLELPM